MIDEDIGSEVNFGNKNLLRNSKNYFVNICNTYGVNFSDVPAFEK